MNRSLKALCTAILLVASFRSAKSQEAFIDSIRYMVTELDSSIQFAPINSLLKRAISHCNGNTMSDSLTATLKQLISDDYIFLGGLQQPVSPHLLTKYVPFILRISIYIADNDTVAENKENRMRVALVMNRPPEETGNLAYPARQVLLQIHFTQPFDRARWSYYLAQTYRDGENGDTCYALYKQSLLQNPNTTRAENIFYAKTLYHFATYCYRRNKRDTAFVLLQQQAELRKKIHGEHSSEYAYWLLMTADQYTYMAKYKLAQTMNFKALEITRNAIGHETSQYALCLNDISEVYYRTGEYDKSLPYAIESLNIKRRIFGKDYFDNVVSLHNLATLYTRMGLYNEAIPLLEESLGISKKYFGEKMVYAFDLHPLAEVYTYLGEYHKALPLYQRSLQIQNDILKAQRGNHKNVFYPAALHSIATLYTKLGQYNKAIELFNQALEIKKDVFGEMNPEYTKTLNSYAEACLLNGDPKKSLLLQLQSISLTRKLFAESHPNLATGLFNLASLYYQQNSFQKAGEACKQALTMQNKIFGNRHPDVATSLDMLGDIYVRQYRYNTALNYYQQAFEIRKNTMAPTHPAYVSSLYHLGITYLKKGSIQKAAYFFMEADSAALLHIEQSYITLSEDEKTVYLHNIEKHFQYLPSLLYLHGRVNPHIANRIFGDAFVLKSMVLFRQHQIYNSIRKSNDTAALQMYHLWRLNKAFLGRQLLLPSKNRQPDFDSLQDITNQMEEQLSRTSVSFRNNSFQRGIDAGQVSEKLSKTAAAVEFIRFRLYNNKWTDSVLYAALVLLPGRADAVFVPLFEERQLKKLMAFSNNRGEAAVDYLYPAAGKETEVSRMLYRLVWQPIRPLLTGIQTVYYSPCGLLFRLSFNAIHDGNGKFLVDNYHLKQLLSTRSLVFTEGWHNFSDAGLWGGIDYDDTTSTGPQHLAKDDSANSLFADFPSLTGYNKNYPATFWKPLPGSKTETGNIFSLLNGKNIVCKLESESSASEEQFKKMDGNAPSLLHIATHGFFLPSNTLNHPGNDDLYLQNSFSIQQNPMFRSGLLLAGCNVTWAGTLQKAKPEDGVLTSYEISHLDLDNTQLVTLSACETALGDIEENEGVYGLQRAFKMAGVKQVLMTLWAVPDKETTELMVKFYSSLLRGDDAGLALQNAQLEMKKKYTPYYWAGFVLTE